MIVIWKPPALAITLTSGLINFAWMVAALLIFNPNLDPSKELNTASKIIVVLFLLITGACIAGTDITFRRNRGLNLFSLQASTLFFVVPTWTVGAVISGCGLFMAIGLFLL